VPTSLNFLDLMRDRQMTIRQTDSGQTTDMMTITEGYYTYSVRA